MGRFCNRVVEPTIGTRSAHSAIGQNDQRRNGGGDKKRGKQQSGHRDNFQSMSTSPLTVCGYRVENIASAGLFPLYGYVPYLFLAVKRELRVAPGLLQEFWLAFRSDRR